MLNKVASRLAVSFAHRRCAEPLKASILSLIREYEIARRSRHTLPRFSTLGRGLRLNLGCGPDVRPGWVNIDVNLNNDASGEAFYDYDVRRGLPLPDGSASYVYSSHFFEHLPNPDGRRLLAECRRVLEPGGTIRLALPHWRPFFAAYLEGRLFDYVPPQELESRPACAGDIVNSNIYQRTEHQQPDHVCYYDEERTMLALSASGFSEPVVSEYDPAVDLADEVRRRYSFYVEARG